MRNVFFAMGGNFLSAAPDTEATAAALRSCALTVHVATKPNRSHLVHGREALILPTLGRTERDCRGGKEQFVTVEDSMGAVHASRGTLEPAFANSCAPRCGSSAIWHSGPSGTSGSCAGQSWRTTTT